MADNIQVTPGTGPPVRTRETSNGQIQVVTNAYGDASVSSVSASATNVTLLAANDERLGATVVNDSVSATLYLKCGATASTTSFTVKLAPGAYWELPYAYNGAIHGIWDAASGSARLTEFT